MVKNALGNWFGNVGVCFAGIENLVLKGASGGLMLGSLTGDQSARFLPNLQSLSLQDITEASEDELCKFITLRKAAGVVLPDILLNPASWVSMRHLDWLKTQVEVIECNSWLDQSRYSKMFDQPEF